MRTSAILVAAGIFLTACATTETQTADTSSDTMDPAAPAAESVNNPDDVRCETETVSGSRLPGRRVCRTNAEWAAIRDRGREYTRDIQRVTPPINEGN